MKINKCIICTLIFLAFSLAGCGTGFSNNEGNNGVQGNIGVTNITPPIEGYHKDPQWSPDGKYISFTEVSNELWFYDLHTKEYEHIKEAEGIDDYTWKNNDVIAYFIGEDFYEMSITDRKPKLLTTALSLCRTISWDSKENRYFMTLDDSIIYWYSNDQFKPIHEEVLTGVLSPDNEWVVYNFSPNDVLSQINLLNIKENKITARFKPSNNKMTTRSLTWSPDSKWIAFYGGPSEDLTGIYVMPRDGTNPPEQIFDIEIGGLDWSPRGDQLVATIGGYPLGGKVLLLDLPEKYKTHME